MEPVIITGSVAALYVGSAKIGKCRDMTLNTSRQKLETTKLGDRDRTYIAGLRDTTGSANLFYDQADPAIVAIMESVYNDVAPMIEIKMLFDVYTGKRVRGQVILEALSIPVAFGAVTVCSIQFQITGKPEVVF
jgi:hypothetical protein